MYNNMPKLSGEYFQHNKKVAITEKSYKYVRKYKKELLLNICKLLKDIDVKYVIGHGNLIEYERGMPIYHDDDLDIRMNIEDINKWEKYCNENESAEYQPKHCCEWRCDKYNLEFDGRFKNIEAFSKSGLQVTLVNSEDFEFEMDIHCDLVPSITNAEPAMRMRGVIDKFWTDYDIDYSNLRKIKYLDIDTFAPNIEDTKRLLVRQYGDDYLIPLRKTPKVFLNHIYNV
tara:strand:+ start:171 stop:857 length:687 start_codon:yes stop_codon:yes gene_type:complete